MHTFFVSVIITKNDEIVVIGIDESDGFSVIVKYDKDGNLLDESIYEQSAFATVDEGPVGIVVTGIDEDYYGLALLYDDNFNIKWAKKILILSKLIIFLINIYHMFF